MLSQRSLLKKIPAAVPRGRLRRRAKPRLSSRCAPAPACLSESLRWEGKSMSLVMPKLNQKVPSRRDDIIGVPLGAVGISGDISDNDEICALAGTAAARLTAQGH